MISQKLIDELKQIIKEDYKKELTNSKAHEVGETLVTFFDLLIAIDQKNKRKNGK